MMGKQDHQESLFSYNLSLERRIPATHPLRQVRRLIDFSFVREVVAPTYGSNGNVSVDPEVILKLLFLLFFDHVSSERELMRMLPYRLDYLWFLGFGLEQEIPDHSVLSKARRRWGRSVFEAFFIRTVRQCVSAGLVDGSKLHVDGSLIAANASNASVVEGAPELIAALKAAYRETESRLEEESSEHPEPGTGEEEGDGGGGSSSGDRPRNDSLLCRTDPDAPLIRRRGLPARPRYKHHRAVDDRCGVITACVTTPGDVEENRELLGLLSASEAATGIAVQTAVGDAQYGTAENFRELFRRGIRPHLGLKKRRATGLYSDEIFDYDAATDRYTCPAGQTLKRRHFKPLRKAFYYGGSAAVCRGCGRREACTRSRHGRTVMRHVDHEWVEAGRRVSRSAAAKRDRARRKFLAEGSFADAANSHGFKRSRWRGLWRQTIQDLLIAFYQNVRKLLLAAAPPRRKATAIRIARLENGLKQAFLFGRKTLWGWREPSREKSESIFPCLFKGWCFEQI